MSLNATPSAERLHIGFFGMRNAGKSSLVNSVTGQQLSVVSDVKGTTTDPVKKAMELLPLGPVVIIDTPGIDDVGELGELRVKKAKEILAITHIAVLVVDCQTGKTKADEELIAVFEDRKVPYIVAYNKSDLLEILPETKGNEIYVSAKDGTNINELKNKIGALASDKAKPRYIVSDLLEKGSHVILVVPIDESAPKGRLILPQQMTMRDLLDGNCSFTTCQVSELESALRLLKNPPDLVITDSQVFGKVSAIVPESVSLTSFSILMARYKGDLSELVNGALMLKNLEDGDKVLISEGCTHHRQCNDIGTVKIPGWIKDFSGCEPSFDFTSGGEFPEDLSGYKLIVHCGGCMLNEREMQNRIARARKQNIPIVNYGVAIAHINGILKRSIEIFPDLYKKI